MSGPVQRLDKWLWFARFFKSRSLATRFCAAGRMRVNGATVSKPHHGVRIGDVLTFALGPNVRIVRVLGLGQRRGPAPEARLLYDDLDPPTPAAARIKGAPAAAAAERRRGEGRPTKAERRALDRLCDGE